MEELVLHEISHQAVNQNIIICFTCKYMFCVQYADFSSLQLISSLYYKSCCAIFAEQNAKLFFLCASVLREKNNNLRNILIDLLFIVCQLQFKWYHQGYNARKVNWSCVYHIETSSHWAEFVKKKNRCISVRLVSEEDKRIKFW